MKQQGLSLIVAGVVLWALAGAAFGTLRSTYGQRPADVNVRWAESVNATSRDQLELAYHLTRGEQLEGRTWSYRVTDVSKDNLRRLVEDPAVDDTHQIHRTAFRIWRGATRGPYLTSRPAWVASVLEFVVQAFVAAGGLAIIVGLFKTWRARRIQDGTASR
ncbi:MAG: hypothetical protein O2930_09090 [Acidobacteria bacterium]|nr:hypothetical protein [Acidobacteriota bacterium]